MLGQDVISGHTQLAQTANAIRASMKENLKFHQSLRVETWPRQNDSQFSASLAVIEEWISRDLVADKLKAVRVPRDFLDVRHG